MENKTDMYTAAHLGLLIWVDGDGGKENIFKIINVQ